MNLFDLSTLTITNHGQLITETNYFDSAHARAEKVIVSPNAGAIRCLIPPALAPLIGELRQAEYAIVTLGPYHGEAGIEILWEDHSDTPHAWHMTAASCTMLPGDPGDSQWVISLWIEKKGKPHKALERKCYWRRAPTLPWLKPLDPPPT